ncbi:zinc transporter 11-like [Malus domestica]|uniref:zinc transporter 11-like n=1 Tax=Malus domestica TaxID=3750 RepID=UPI003975CC12
MKGSWFWVSSLLGVCFFGTAMMHFLSDSNETFKDLTQEEYPFAFMLACGGFLLTMLADCVISYVFLKNKSVVSAADLQVQGNTEQGRVVNMALRAIPKTLWLQALLHLGTASC